ncbi:hypothetical protein CYMTET_48114 [Cymbomonas tetramitiformis]|uniref:Uncharacterized protein n=1 Tax=Cymbomonas tetramitiformis TaxID=36881 RepID=A0AAE0BSX4_9CHLO|nr:hypothetical protein CYMTET_48114 [Cymbomonas tetramitiformis]
MHRLRRPAPLSPLRPAGTAAPAAAATPRQPAAPPSLQFAAVVDDAVGEDGDPAAFTFRPPVDRGGLDPSPPDVYGDDDDWPALRKLPWIPSFQGTAAASKPPLKEDHQQAF